MPGIGQLGALGQGPAPRTFFVNNNAGQQQSVSQTGGPLLVPLKPTQSLLVPSGNFIVDRGCYSDLQYWDAQSLMWRNFSSFGNAPVMVASDGQNVQIANTTGCPIAAVVTTRGSGLINGFYGYNQLDQAISIVAGQTTLGNAYLTCTPSAGGSLWNVFVGGGISTTVTITAGGTNYISAPTLLVIPPANQGAQPYIQATANCTVSAGAINAVTVTNQGAGYVSAPTILVVNAENDTTGGNAVLTPVLINTGTVSAVTVADSGTAPVSAVPTLAFAGTSGGGSAAATVIMNFSLTTISAVASAGAAYGTSLQYATLTAGGNNTATATNTNPSIETQQIQPPRPPTLQGSSAGGGTITAVPTIIDGGYGFATIPSLAPYPSGAAALTGVTLATFTAVWGGNNDNCYLNPI